MTLQQKLDELKEQYKYEDQVIWVLEALNEARFQRNNWVMSEDPKLAIESEDQELLNLIEGKLK